MFMMGLFYKKATANAALVTAILSIPMSAAMKFMTPEVPFLTRMGYVFLISVLLIVVISWFEGKGEDNPKAVSLSGTNFKGEPIFAMASFGILGITAALYAIFW